MFCIISTSDLEHLGGALGGESLCYRDDGGQDRHQDPVHHTPHHGDVVPITTKKPGYINFLAKCCQFMIIYTCFMN